MCDWPEKCLSQALLLVVTLYVCNRMKYLTGMQGIFFCMKQIKSDVAVTARRGRGTAATDVNNLNFYGLQGDRYQGPHSEMELTGAKT